MTVAASITFIGDATTPGRASPIHDDDYRVMISPLRDFPLLAATSGLTSVEAVGRGATATVVPVP